jgi:hypothetical protein
MRSLCAVGVPELQKDCIEGAQDRPARLMGGDDGPEMRVCDTDFPTTNRSSGMRYGRSLVSVDLPYAIPGSKLSVGK